MDSTNIQDRIHEKPRLIDAFNKSSNDRSESDQNAAIIVYSTRGTGKTTLIEAAMQEAGIEPITVKIPAQAQVGLLSPGFYFDSIVDTFKDFYPDVSLFSESRFGVDVTFDASFEIPTGLPSLGFSVAPKKKRLRDDEVRRRNASSIITFCQHRKIRPTFHLERCNVMDAESLVLVHHLAANIPNSRFVFEYSVIPPFAPEEAAIDFKRNISESFHLYETLPLEKLGCEDAMRAISDKVDTSSLTADELRSCYERSGGNMLLFEEYCRDLVHSQIELDHKTAPQNANNCAFILAIVALFQESVSFDQVKRIVSYSQLSESLSLQVDSVCENLIEDKRIEVMEDGYIRLSPSEDIDKILSGPIAYIAYGAYVGYLQNKLAGPMSLNLSCKLLDAQLRFFDPEAISTIESIRPIICTSKPSEAFFVRSVNFAHYLIEKDGVDSLRTKRAILALFSVFFSAADYNRAGRFLDEIGESCELQICRFAVDSTNPKSRNMNQRAADIERSYPKNSRIGLFARVSYLSFLMRTACEKESIDYANNILRDDALKCFPEYWWILKLHSHFMPLPQAILELQEAVSSLKRLGSERMAARAEITLTSMLARSGSTDDALEMLKQGIDRCSDTFCRVGVYLNNMGACLLVSQENPRKALDLIRQAKTYTATPYEQTLMLSNELIACILLEDWVRADIAARDLASESRGNYAAVRYKHTRYTNLLYYYNARNKARDVLRMRDLLTELLPYSSFSRQLCITAQLNGERLEKGSDYAYVANLGYWPGFIGYWQCEFEDDHIEALLSNNSLKQL